jgi:uncharacterized membrane protein
MPERLRFDRLDALRGTAIVWMAVFHFCFDLNHFGFFTSRYRFTVDPLWTTQRTMIVTLFLFTAGLAQAVALQQGQSSARFWRRWAQIAGCAVLVSIGSAWMFPRSWISFGVLHGIAVMLIVLRALAWLERRGIERAARSSSVGGSGDAATAAAFDRWLWVAGLVAIVLPLLWRHEAFDGPWLRWVGLVTRKPVTEDYVPVLPWLGVMLWGLATGRMLLARAPALLRGRLPRGLAPLAALGRWSLTFYMVHQPVLIGLLMAWIALRR